MPKIYVFYHYLHPDDVVSSVHFSQLCAALVERGWDVTAFPCNRGCRDDSIEYPPDGEFDDVRVERIWRPAWRQSSSIGRILNAAWMILRWSLLATQRERKPDVVIVGTDPILSVLVAIVWRFFKPRTVLANWCFDLYPEAAYADGLLKRNSFLARLLQALLKKAYRACDLVVDIGPCMRKLLLRYDSSLHMATLVPWAFAEPSYALPIPAAEREAVFGSSPFGLLYSGTFGRAHSYETILELARLLSSDDVHLAFSVRGNRENALRIAVHPEDANISLVPFAAAEAKLEDRLACADVHVVSLREEWVGTVVPSKFFGALAIGRPVLFCGDRSSSIAQWIEQYELGWVLTPENIPDVAASMRAVLKDPSAMQRWRQRCHQVYGEHFSRAVTVSHWDSLLRALLDEAHRTDAWQEDAFSRSELRKHVLSKHINRRGAE